eukprot:gene9555-9717_t
MNVVLSQIWQNVSPMATTVGEPVNKSLSVIYSKTGVICPPPEYAPEIELKQPEFQ